MFAQTTPRWHTHPNLTLATCVSSTRSRVTGDFILRYETLRTQKHQEAMYYYGSYADWIVLPVCNLCKLCLVIMCYEQPTCPDGRHRMISLETSPSSATCLPQDSDVISILCGSQQLGLGKTGNLKGRTEVDNKWVLTKTEQVDDFWTSFWDLSRGIDTATHKLLKKALITFAPGAL